MSQRLTLDDIARLSGVSRSAASRAINNRPGVRPDVRERVTRIADDFGFTPNRAAKHLASGQSSVIGLVIPSVNLRIDPYGTAMTHAVGRAASALDLGLMLHLVNDEPGATVQRILREGFLDGLLISSVAAGTWVDELFEAPVPSVLIGTHPTRDDVVSVDVENVESSALAVEHLFERGCERVGCIVGPLDRADARERLAGYRLAHERAGRGIDDALVVEGDYSRQSGIKAAPRLFEAGVDGIFASNDEMALGAMWSAAHRGVRVPDDVMLMGFDGTATDEIIEPSLSTVSQPFDRIAGVAVGLLKAIVGGRTDVTSARISPELVVGGSTAPR